MTALSSEEMTIDSPFFRENKVQVYFKPQLWIGSGTNYNGANIRSNIYPIITLSACQVVTWLRDEGLPISTIADMMNVERKSIYAWLKGGAINPHNKERLEEIYSLLKEHKCASLRNLYRFWMQKNSSNKSLSIMFQESELDKTSIRATLKMFWCLAKKEQDREILNPVKTTVFNNPVLRDSRIATSDNS